MSTQFLLLTSVVSLMAIAFAVAYFVWYFRERTLKSRIETIYVKGNDETAAMYELLGTNLTHDIRASASGVAVCEEFFIETLRAMAEIISIKYVKGTVSADGVQDERFFMQDRKHYLLEGKSGKLILTLDVSHWKAEKTIGVGYDVSSYADQDGNIPVSEGIYLRVPTINCDEVCQLEIMDAVRASVQATSVQRILTVDDRKETAHLFYIRAHDTHLSLASSAFNYVPLDPALLDLSYEPASVSYDQQYDRVPMSQVVQLQSDLLRAGKNCVIMGPTGVGKTTVCRDIWARLVKDGYMVVKLDHDTIDANQSQLQAVLEENIFPMLAEGMYKGVIFAIDEAKALFDSTKANDIILDLMDGIRKRENVVMGVMISINATAADLDLAILRPGRAHSVTTLAYLSRKRAEALCKHIQQHRPDLKFNQPLLDNILNHGKFVEGVKIHDSGLISAADIWNGVFRPYDEQEKFAKILAPYATKKQQNNQPNASAPPERKARATVTL